MTRDLVKRAANGTVANVTMSRELETLVEDLAFPSNYGTEDDPYRAPLPSIPRRLARAAADILPTMEALYARPISREQLRNWLIPINGSVANAQDDAAFKAKLDVAAYRLGIYPSEVLTPATQREAMGRFKFWPAVADLVELLAPHAARIEARLEALRKIAKSRPAPDTPREATQEPTQGEKDYVRGLVASLTATSAPREKCETVARHMTPGQLIRMYREQLEDTNPNVRALARTRLAQLGGE